jgi:hypothetical protein
MKNKSYPLCVRLTGCGYTKWVYVSRLLPLSLMLELFFFLVSINDTIFFFESGTRFLSQVFRPDLFLYFAPARARALGFSSGSGSQLWFWLDFLWLLQFIVSCTTLWVASTIPLLAVPPLSFFFWRLLQFLR